MKIYGNAWGAIVRLAITEDETNRYPDAPSEAVYVLECDTISNKALADDMRLSTDPYTLIAGVLKKNGVVVAINPDSSSTTDRKEAAALVKTLIAYNKLGSPTNAQTVAAVKANNRLTLVVARLLKQEASG